MKYDMKLQDKPFNSIKDGIKTIEMRLNDEKRSKIKVGDYIDFTNMVSGEVIHTIVENLYYYNSFSELYENHDKISLGYEEDEVASYQDMEKYYSKEEQAKYGVVGIEIRILKNKE